MGDYARQMALVNYQMGGIPGATERSMGDVMQNAAERGTVWGGGTLRGLADAASGGVGRYLSPLTQGGQATGNWTLGTAGAGETYGNALNQAMLSGASNASARYLGAGGF